MKKTEELDLLRKSSIEDLVNKRTELEDESMRLRFSKSSAQLTNSARIKAVRKQIARVNTVISEAKLSQAEQS